MIRISVDVLIPALIFGEGAAVTRKDVRKVQREFEVFAGGQLSVCEIVGFSVPNVHAGIR